MRKWHIIPIVLVIIIMLSMPAFSMIKEESDYRYESVSVPLEVGILSLAGVGGIFTFIKRKKIFMRKHTFRFEKIDKKLREDND